MSSRSHTIYTCNIRGYSWSGFNNKEKNSELERNWGIGRLRNVEKFMALHTMSISAALK